MDLIRRDEPQKDTTACMELIWNSILQRNNATDFTDSRDNNPSVSCFFKQVVFIPDSKAGSLISIYLDVFPARIFKAWELNASSIPSH
jgi:hypothetical protein